MQNTKLIQLFATLTKEELKKLEKYLESPYFHTKLQSRQLMQHLAQQFDKWYLLYHEYRDSTEKDPELENKLESLLSKEAVAEALFPDVPYNDQKMRRIIFESKKVLSDFLFQLALSNQPRLPELKQITLLQHHLKRGELALFESQLKEAQQYRDNLDNLHSQYFEYAYQVEELYNNYLINTRGRDDSFQLMSDHLDTAYLISKLRIFCAMLTRSKVYKFKYEYRLMDELTDAIESFDFSTAPLLEIYYLILKLEREKAKPGDYKRLYELIGLHQPHIPLTEVRQIYGFMLNYLLRESRKPKTDYYPEIFSLLQKMIKEDLIYADGQIAPYYFELCVSTAGKVKAFDFAEDFIYEHEDRLIGKDAQEVFDFSLLVLLFYKGEYRAILKRIDMLKFKVVRSQIRLRILKLKTLFESKETESFFLLCDSLKKFIRSKKEIGETAHTFYYNFVSLADKLGKIAFNQRKSEGMEQEIEETQAAEKEWLMEKYLELA